MKLEIRCFREGDESLLLFYLQIRFYYTELLSQLEYYLGRIIMAVQRLRKKTDKLLSQMGSFEYVIPAFQGQFVCEIVDSTIKKLQKDGRLTASVMSWFEENKGQKFDTDIFFDVLQEETGEVISEELQIAIESTLKTKNESITVKRLSMLSLMKGKQYPSDLSAFVQNMYKQQGDQAKEQTAEDQSDALSFQQWIVCYATIDPKVMSLTQVLKFFKTGQVDSHWFEYNDFQKIREIRRVLSEKDSKKELEIPLKEWTETQVRELPQFAEELWPSNDPLNPGKMVNVWWVEDFVSDVDLVNISGAALNGPNAEARENLKPFRRE